MGIEIRIEASDARDAQQQMAQLLAGAMPNFTLNVGGQNVTVDDDVNAEPDPDAKVVRSRGRKKAEAPTLNQFEEPTAGEGNASAGTAAAGTGSNQAEAGPATAPTADTSSSDEPTEVTYADVQKAVTGLAAAKGRDAVVAIYKQFGVDHGTKLTPEQWAPAIEALTAAREAA